MKNMILMFVLLGQVFLAEGACDKEQARAEIQYLIKQHEQAMPEKEFVKMFDLKIEEDGKRNKKLMDINNIIRFTFMGNTIFRHYAYSSGVDARVLLKQRTEGYFEKQEEKTLLEVVKKGDDNSITYYDYEFEEHNDFLLTFFPVNESEGCAILIVYQIVDKNSKYIKNKD